MKESAYELAEPIADLFNLSLSSGIVPDTWKCYIIPIPKEKIPKEESNLRPIFLTPCISKVVEEFVAEWILEDIAHKIDHKVRRYKSHIYKFVPLGYVSQLVVKFGYARPVFANLFSRFRKAFDRINLNILVTKLVFLGVRRTLLLLIYAVLSKIANNELSWVNLCVRVGHSECRCSTKY